MMSKEYQGQREQLSLVLTVDDVQRLLRISRAKAYELTHISSFPVLRIGRTIRIPRDPFLVWLSTRENQREQSRG